MPTHLTVEQLLEQNEALRAAGDDDTFYALELLAFDVINSNGLSQPD